MAALLLLAMALPAEDPPQAWRLRAGTLLELRVDGVLDEAAWQSAEAIPTLMMIEPRQGEPGTGKTEVRALAGPKAIAFGIRCEDPEPAGIVSFTKERDGDLESEDHVRIVLGPFLDGRSGYVFAVNPGGARYDALISPGGEDGGTLHELDVEGVWTPSPRVTLALNFEKNVGRLPQGRFDQTQVGFRVRLNLSPDLQLNSFVQYDDESREVGTNTRARWIFHPQGELFVIYNHNLREIDERFQRDSNELLLKAQYTFRR